MNVSSSLEAVWGDATLLLQRMLSQRQQARESKAEINQLG